MSDWQKMFCLIYTFVVEKSLLHHEIWFLLSMHLCLEKYVLRRVYSNIIRYKHTGNDKGLIWVQLIVFMLLIGMRVDGLTCDFYTIAITFYINKIIIFSYPFENGCVTYVCIT